jgi:putative lipoic acid-binding regulatory protein
VTSDNRDRLRLLLESQHDFPGSFTFKVIYRSAPGVAEGILAAVAERTGLRELVGPPSFRPSSGGKYTAMTFDLQVQVSDDVLRVYSAMQGLESVVSCM